MDDLSLFCRSTSSVGAPGFLNSNVRCRGFLSGYLSATLKNLERDGLVIREVFPEVPPRVEYEMTDLGKSLLRPTQGLVDWAKANWERVP